MFNEIKSDSNKLTIYVIQAGVEESAWRHISDLHKRRYVIYPFLGTQQDRSLIFVLKKFVFNCNSFISLLHVCMFTVLLCLRCRLSCDFTRFLLKIVYRVWLSQFWVLKEKHFRDLIWRFLSRVVVLYIQIWRIRKKLSKSSWLMARWINRLEG